MYSIFSKILFRKKHGRAEGRAVRKIIQEPLGKELRLKRDLNDKQRNRLLLLLLLSLVFRALVDHFLKINRLLSNRNNLQDLDYYQVAHVQRDDMIKPSLGKIADGAVVILYIVYKVLSLYTKIFVTPIELSIVVFVFFFPKC